SGMHHPDGMLWIRWPDPVHRINPGKVVPPISFVQYTAGFYCPTALRLKVCQFRQRNIEEAHANCGVLEGQRRPSADAKAPFVGT
ncbi:hypothetical protein, partial [Staphylococcus aureus]|uniref:hypothetical protein n=1 Tax=Staphylococcus aureus TaxID=1280 RepID=UPI0021B13BEB